jgi:hypothetical protein
MLKILRGVFYLQSVNNKEFLYNEKLEVIKINEYLNLSLFKFFKASIVIEIFGKVIKTIFIDDAFLQSSDLEDTHSLFSVILHLTAILLLLSFRAIPYVRKILVLIR